MSPPLTILIVDDEQPARRKLTRFLRELRPAARLIEAANGLEAMEQLENEDIILVLLDIQMPGMTGLELVEAFGPENMPTIVFTTAYDEYAIQAFEHGALDYLLKPFDRDRLEKALNRVQSINLGSSASAEPAPQIPADALARLLELNARQPPLDRILVRENNKIIPIAVADIHWLEADDKYVRIHTQNTKHYLRHTITGLEKRLDPARFLRCHRSTIVNLDAIAELESLSHGDYQIKLKSGSRLTLSRRYSAKLKHLLIE